MKRIFFSTLMLSLLISSICFADTIQVPGDQPTIQAGIDAAVNGDTVLVAPGTYFEVIDFLGKAITVKSADGAEATVIDGIDVSRSDFKSIASFRSNEGADSVLEGFTLTNGKGTYFEYYPGRWKYCGGGILCEDSSPTITNNHIIGNQAEMFGGGIYCTSSSPTIVNNRISWNVVNFDGGGICCRNDSTPIVENNRITHNIGRYTGGGISAGLLVSKSNAPLIVRNIIGWNESSHGGGISCLHATQDFKIVNNTIIENEAIDGGGISCWYEGNPMIANNIISGNTASMLAGGIYLLWSSPCITNNIFAWNSAKFGGGIHFHQSPTTLTNNTFVRNSATIEGGGINCTSLTDLKVLNSIFWGNSSPKGPEIRIGNKFTASHIDISYSTVKDGQAGVHVEPNCLLTWGYGMLESDPQFVNSESDDFHLKFTSPCRNAGHNSIITELNDFEGDPRIAHGTVDIGADEFHTHLYCTGEFVPRGHIEGKFVGLPDTWPVGLFIGSGVMDPPVHQGWGDFFLEAPWVVIPLSPIPSDGILTIPEMIPALPIAPYDIPMQALIGWELSNLFVLEVR